MSTPFEFNADRALFGKVIKRWFASHDLPQVITEHWAKANASPGPWASQMSQCMAGKIDPKPAFFVSLGAFNLAIETGELGHINDRRSMDRLKAAKPLCHDDGTVYTAQDFFALFTGLIDPPRAYAQDAAADMTQDLVDEWASTITSAFKQACRAQMMTPKELFPILIAKTREYAPELMDHDAQLIQDVILGIAQPSLQDAESWHSRFPGFPVLQALKELGLEREEQGPIDALLSRLALTSFTG